MNQVDGDSDMAPTCVCRGAGSVEEEWFLPVRRLLLQLSPGRQTTHFLPVCPWCLSSCCPALELGVSESE